MTCKCFARCEADCVCGHDWTPPAVIALREEVERLRAELAEWRKDAERYRWIRIAQNLDRVYELDGEVLDQMIDTARKGEGE